ncbi:MAG: GNAT family N-acetyltransferase [Corynebacteriales bacterium]|nr:GNAT family N-acetyltransferase [Mycobacteriales bacterium]
MDEFDAESYIDLPSAVSQAAQASQVDKFRTLAAALDRNEHYIAQVAYSPDEIDRDMWIGLAITRVHVDQTAEVLSLWVDRAHRGASHPEQRIADTLMTHALKTAKNLGATRAEGFVNPAREHTLHFSPDTDSPRRLASMTIMSM